MPQLQWHRPKLPGYHSPNNCSQSLTGCQNIRKQATDDHIRQHWSATMPRSNCNAESKLFCVSPLFKLYLTHSFLSKINWHCWSLVCQCNGAELLWYLMYNVHGLWQLATGNVFWQLAAGNVFWQLTTGNVDQVAVNGTASCASPAQPMSTTVVFVPNKIRIRN